jgi:K+/H+ antiporter YhaU regulatory subunit KhtT
MEVNTVVISLDRLKELELAEKKLELPRSKTIITISDRYSDFKIDTDDECDRALALKIKDQEYRIQNLLGEIKRLEKEFDNTTDAIKELNYWGFCNWRRS